MARQTINTGTTANDGTGDSLRNAGNKINQNFQELYTFLGESDQVSPYLFIDSDGIHFNGESVNSFKTILEVEDPTQNNTITLPDSSGNVVLDTSAQTLFNKTMAATALTEPRIKDDDSSHNYQIVPGSLTANIPVNLPNLADSDDFVMAKHTQTLENKTLDSATLNFPKINQIVDNNGATITKYNTIGSAVNYISINNEETTYPPSIYADGADTDINLAIGGKGTGALVIDTRVALANTTLTADGYVDSAHPLTIFNSPAPIIGYVGDGSHIGELKYFVNKGAGTATITPTNLAGGGSTTLNQHQAGFMIWTGATWHLASKQ